jgi:hypothetical protein
MEMITVPYSVFCDFGNLSEAHLRARQGRRDKRPVIRFENDVMTNLTELQEELKNKTYRQGPFYKFYISDPRKRQIQSIPYRDRIVQHVLCDMVLTPYFTKRVIYDNCGCIIGRGQCFAMKRMKTHLRKFLKQYKTGYFLKCDISKYFPSMSHSVIKENMGTKIADEDIRRLFYQIIDAYQTPHKFLTDNNISTDIKRGVSVGSQSSQVIGFYYLDPMDRYIKEKLRIKHYVRYMDDFVIIHHDKDYLKQVLHDIIRGLEGRLKLKLNDKTQISPLSQGVKFLGILFYIKNGRIITKIQKRTIKKYKTVVRYVNRHPETAKENAEHYISVFASYNGYFKHTNSRGKAHEIKRKLNVSIKPPPKTAKEILMEV